ncbi:MAG: preprotein translocase subunit SecY [Thaumarchaeota archaeon]|nr:preprotein translocase subunit SecY [Candidatus Wolframiiraptor allenii]
MSLRQAVESIAKYLPEVKKPVRRPSLGERLIWTALVLVIYTLMGHTMLYGVSQATRLAGQSPLIMSIIFAQRIGTLTTLGIGPIVTAGLILQLLVGAQIIKLDLSKPEDRTTFTALSKLFTIAVIIVEAAVYTVSGMLGHLEPSIQAIVFIQLVAATMLIVFMDELIQKGWGLGSGVSLFIAAGVAETIFTNLFSPIVLPDRYYQGIILALAQVAAGHGSIIDLLYRGRFPDIMGLISTIAILLLIVYLESLRIEVPIQHARVSGYVARYPIKFLYVSNIPVIFTSVIFTNIYFFSTIIWSRFNPANQDPILNLIGSFNATEYGPVPLGGLAYYVTSPGNVARAAADPLRAVIYTLIMLGFCVLFAKFWVEVGGLSPQTVADQLVKAGMQVPGFRRAPAVIARMLERYIRTLTILSAIIVGLIAVFGDYFNVYGGGIGILLMTGILMQYYELLLRERLEEMSPVFRRLLGE